MRRVVADAFNRAEARPRKHLTLVHKTNVLEHAGSLWSRIVEEVSLEHPEVTVAYSHVDAATIHILLDTAIGTQVACSAVREKGGRPGDVPPTVLRAGRSRLPPDRHRVVRHGAAHPRPPQG